VAFKDEHAPSIPAKVLLSASILAGVLVAAALTAGYPEWLVLLFKDEKGGGNAARQLLFLSCGLIYLVRFIICMFVFLKRHISWLEGGLVSFLFFMMFYLFGTSAGSHPEALGVIDLGGVCLYLVGSIVNTLADYQRFAWKRRSENKGRLYTQGLFRHAMHINYFGDSVLYIGLALITREWVCLYVAIGISANFIILQIPMLDRHLKNRYGGAFDEYAKQTKKFIPFVY
jgi:protein-S-isoprenylcysteine O-methyltransferase Ste14